MKEFFFSRKIRLLVEFGLDFGLGLGFRVGVGLGVRICVGVGLLLGSG